MSIEVNARSTVACVKVIGGTQPDCVSSPTFAVMPTIEDVVAKVPVTLAELSVKINLDSIITLPEPALEIKKIKKRVKVTQCLLLQPTNVLFIKGFIRKNIEYATLGCSTKEGVCGDIRHCTVDVPFKCTTNVNFTIPPQGPVVNTQAEFSYFRKQPLSGYGFAEKDQLLSGDLSEFNLITQEFFNELPFCELINARILEYDEYLNRTRPHGKFPFEERLFRQVEEKAILFITLKILQKLQVPIPGEFECEEEFICEDPFTCADFQCEDIFECDDTFTCGEEFNCESSFDCIDPFTCGNEFACFNIYEL